MSKENLRALLNDASEQVEEAHTAAEKINKPSKQNSSKGFVVAIIQNRAKEVGLAALDTTTCSTLWLAQYVEATRSFTTTLTMLELYPPEELLIVAPKDHSMPEMGLNDALAGFETTPRPRGDFDDSEGTVLVQTCAMRDSFAELTSSRGSYLALGAAGALLKFMQEQKSMVLAASCLQVKQALSTHHMHIDAASIEALELVQSNASSLLNFLDGTRTRAGSQLLRANLLQPLKDVSTLNARYDALGELRANTELMFTLDQCLLQLPKNMDSVIGSLVLRPAKSEASMLRRVAAMIQSFIQLRELLMTLEPLADALRGVDESESELLCALRNSVASPVFAQILMRLEGILEDDVYSARVAFLNRAQQCFALRSESIPMLEIARHVFCSVTEKIHEHAGEMRDQHELYGLKAKYTARRGFYFEININTDGNNPEESTLGDGGGDNRGAPAPGGGNERRRKRGRGTTTTTSAGISSTSRLPSTFSILSTNGRTIQCTTDELNALNARLRDATNDCLCLTEEALDGVSTDIINEHLPALHRLIDGLALLDMLCGFARQLEMSGNDYIRPALTETGPLALVGCRHPVLEVSESGNGSFKFQENDTWLSVDSSLHVITGPNMAGKSTYLRLVAAAVVMAQVGCHVAANFASITPLDRILTRIGTSDSLETNSSSFMVEMQETAYILRNATPQSLVLIDELGRATSTTDGLGVAWAVAESLAATGARTLLATHFVELAELANIYPQCRAFHFSVKTANNSLNYTFELKPGRCKDKNYGLALAAAVAFPQEALERAKTVVEVLDAVEAETAAAHEPDAAQLEESAVWEIVGKLACLSQAFGGVEGEEGNAAEMVALVKKLQQEAAETTQGRVYARIGLLGNPSDGYNGRCLSLSLENFWADVVITPSSDKITFEQRVEGDLNQFSSLHSFISHIDGHGFDGGVRLLMSMTRQFAKYCDEHAIPLDPSIKFSLSYSTNIPRQRGLSGSSAIACGALNCLLKAYEISENQFPVADRPGLILAAEEALGITAGLQDRIIQVYGGLVSMDFTDSNKNSLFPVCTSIDPGQLPSSPPLHLIFNAASPPGKDSGSIHSQFKEKWRLGDEHIRNQMQEIADLVPQGVTALENKDFSKLSSLMKRNFQLRKSMFGEAALCKESLKMIELAELVGVAAKFTGSGGAVVALPLNKEEEETLKEACLKAGLTCLPVVVGPVHHYV